MIRAKSHQVTRPASLESSLASRAGVNRVRGLPGNHLRNSIVTHGRDARLRESERNHGQTIVEGYDAAADEFRTVEAEGHAKSEEEAALIGFSPNQTLVKGDRVRSANIRLNGSTSQPSSWTQLQYMPKGHGAFISGPPVAKSLADISAGGGAGAAGYTEWPAGYAAPDFDFNTTATGAEWFSKPTLKNAASEGISGSFYTSAGKHKTALKEGGNDVYWTFSPAISTLIKVGEQEHCDDFAEAYRISLKEADTIVNTNIVGKVFGPKASKADADGLVLAEITRALSHAGLGNDKTKWAGIYNTLFTKTLNRDSSGWHSISLGARSVDGAGNVSYNVVKGTSQIGTKASSTIIKY